MGRSSTVRWHDAPTDSPSAKSARPAGRGARRDGVTALSIAPFAAKTYFQSP
jgi:predicted nucleic acid-binding Zn ribbon protein